MQILRYNNSDTEVTLTISANTPDLDKLKDHVLEKFKKNVKVQGFREGKAPLELVEKNVDQRMFQSEFLDEAINHLYQDAVNDEKIRPVDNPKIQLKKFVPFTSLEFEAKVEIISKVTLANYRLIKMSKPKVEPVTNADIAEVMNSLKNKVAKRQDVNRAAKTGDQIWLDFKGFDKKAKALPGTDGKNATLIIGEKTYIPEFESNLVGLKPGEKKTFVAKFPKDYRVPELASQEVKFEVDVIKVQELEAPKEDDAFAATVGPFKTISELKDDIKKQLQTDRHYKADRDFESEFLREITLKSKLTIPKVLIDREIERNLNSLKQQLTYQGQTFPEFLESVNKSEEQYIETVLRPDVEERVKASIILSEIAAKEEIRITEPEVNKRWQELRKQYPDEKSLEELDKPEAKNDIASKLITDKTIARLTELVSGK